MHEIEPSEVARERRTLVSPTRPWPLCHKVCVWWGLAILAQIVAIVLQGSALLERPDPEPAPSPSPSSRPWSEDCTAEELNTGVCYLTWDDIREQPTYTQAP